MKMKPLHVVLLVLIAAAISIDHLVVQSLLVVLIGLIVYTARQEFWQDW